MANEIHAAIMAVYAEVGYVQKNRSPNLNYSFAGEAALIAALRPALILHGIYMTVAAVDEIRHETFETSRGSVMNRVTMRGTVRFTHAWSATSIDVQSVGEGADVGDKATAKALTGLYKYAIRETFMIETGDDPDTTPSDEQERAPRPASEHPSDVTRRARVAHNATRRGEELPTVAATQYNAAAAPATAPPDDSIPRCACGPRVYRTGEKNGSPWAAWMCPSNPGKCAPEWV